MRGLEVSRCFFSDWGLPWLERQWPELLPRLAAGRIGGSDTIEADDEWSRDHDWGPSFNVWLTLADYRHFGRRLSREINTAAPREFLGARFRFFDQEKENVTVDPTAAFIESYTGCATPPARSRDWFRHYRGRSLVEREAWLYFLRHGAIFHDPLGEFSERRAAFANYPRDVLLKVIHEQCMTLWYVGEYKFGSRLVYRDDPYPLHSAISQSAEAAMRLCFYLHDDYAPHWQWLHHQFLRLPEARDLAPLLDRFLQGKSARECAEVVPEIMALITKRLADGGWIEGGHHSMQRAANEIKAQISDRAIRELADR